MEATIELLEGQAQRDILRQQPHDCTLKRTPRRAKAGQTLKGFRPCWCRKDRVRIG